MIIKLEDADITTAQDDSEDRGVIHVPDATWNHVIKEVEHQDQEWVNSLYIDVGTLSIGGSGLPIVIDTAVHSPIVASVNTWNFTLLENTTTVTVSSQTLVVVREYSSEYIVETLTTYGTSKSVTLEFSSSYITRYYRFSDATGDSIVYFNQNGNNNVFSLYDINKSDTTRAQVHVNKSFIEFLWINN